MFLNTKHRYTRHSRAHTSFSSKPWTIKFIRFASFVQVSEQDAQEFAASVDAVFAETSAMTSKNVLWLFEDICEYFFAIVWQQRKITSGLDKLPRI